MTLPQRSAQDQPIAAFGAAYCRGARDTRCDFGPHQIRRALDTPLYQQRLRVEWQSMLHATKPAGNPYDDARAFCTQLARHVNDCVRRDQRFAVIGGDHSCAIGTWSGAAAARRTHGAVGLIWIDAHLDSHTPETSHSGALHGMPLATLLGHGDRRLTSIADPRAKLSPAHVCVVGAHSFEPEEHTLLRRMNVRVITMHEIESMGLRAALDIAADIACAAPGGFGVTIDLDAVDPVDAPGVGTPVPGGIPAQQLLAALVPLHRHPQLLGIEIAEFNPFRDRNDKTATLVIDLMSTLL